MAETIAGWLVGAAGLYLAAGLVFAVAFVTVGVGRVDRVAGEGSVGFRLIILPGVVALWPLLARRWLRAGRGGGGTPPEERNPHREAASRLAAARARAGGGAEEAGR